MLDWPLLADRFVGAAPEDFKFQDTRYKIQTNHKYQALNSKQVSDRGELGHDSLKPGFLKCLRPVRTLVLGIWSLFVSCILGFFYLYLGILYFTNRDSGNCACQPNQNARFEAMRRFLLSEDPMRASSVISQVSPCLSLTFDLRSHLEKVMPVAS